MSEAAKRAGRRVAGRSQHWHGARAATTALVAVAALLAAGCSFAPPHQRPDAPVAVQFPGASDPQAGTDATAIGWHDFFADAQLRTLIGRALSSNRDLAVAVSRIEEARAQLGITAASRLPAVDAAADYTAQRALFPFAGVPTAITTRRAGVGVALPAYELDFWGRVRDLSEAARATYLAQTEAARAARIALVGDVAAAWFVLIEAQRRIELTRLSVQSRERALRLSEVRERAGVVSGLDAIQARSLLQSARAELAALERQRSAARNALELLTGSAVPIASEGAALEAQLGQTTIRAGLPSEVLLVRPDVLAAEERLRAANANIGAARAAFFPTIALTGTAGVASAELGDLFASPTRVWSFLPQLRLPLFNAGRLRSQLDLAQARRVTAVAEYERTIQQAFREVADALTAQAALTEQLVAISELEAAQRDRLQIAERRYQEGLSSFLELLDAQRELYTAQQSRVQTQRLQAANTVALYRALGGGQQ